MFRTFGMLITLALAQAGVRLQTPITPEFTAKDYVQNGAVFDLELDSTGAVTESSLIVGFPPFVAGGRQVLDDWQFQRLSQAIGPTHVSAVFLYKPQLTLPGEGDTKIHKSLPERYDETHSVPFLITIVVPGYPLEARGDEFVFLQLELTENGTVRRVDTISPPSVLSVTAGSAVFKWRFHVPPSAVGDSRTAIVVIRFLSPEFQ